MRRASDKTRQTRTSAFWTPVASLGPLAFSLPTQTVTGAPLFACCDKHTQNQSVIFYFARTHLSKHKTQTCIDLPLPFVEGFFVVTSVYVR